MRKLLLLAVAATLSLTSCKKDDDPIDIVELPTNFNEAHNGYYTAEVSPFGTLGLEIGEDEDKFVVYQQTPLGFVPLNNLLGLTIADTDIVENTTTNLNAVTQVQVASVVAAGIISEDVAGYLATQGVTEVIIASTLTADSSSGTTVIAFGLTLTTVDGTPLAAPVTGILTKVDSLPKASGKNANSSKASGFVIFS